MSNKFLSILIGFLALIVSSCSGDTSLENVFAPDPTLKENLNSANQKEVNLPGIFPPDFSIYPQAKLISTDTNKAVWETFDSANSIEEYYQEEFIKNEWELSQKNDNTLVANRGNLQGILTILASVSEEEPTQFTIEYRRIEDLIQAETNNNSNNESDIPTPIGTPINFRDINEVSQQYQEYVNDLAQLGVLRTESDEFNPNQIITRREYARWLVATNNQFYANNPGKQIRLANLNSESAFTDVGRGDSDFPVIQGLAEAGIIPSRLSGDSTAILFRPDAPLTRENLILWKVPLDIHKALPPASIEAVKQTWGFQDTTNIQPHALQALYADFQNGHHANVRRVYGFTILFQPKTPVTRSEAAAALWYFGNLGEGISAKEILKGKS